MSEGQKPAANRMVMMQYKLRVVGAKKGFGLLKKKRDALKARFQAMLREIIDCKIAVGSILNDSAFSLAKSKWACDSDIATPILARCKKTSYHNKTPSGKRRWCAAPCFHHDARYIERQWTRQFGNRPGWSSAPNRARTVGFGFGTLNSDGFTSDCFCYAR